MGLGVVHSLPTLASTNSVLASDRESWHEEAMRRRLEKLLAEYGEIALIIYFVLFGIVLFAFGAAITVGWEVESAKGGVGTLGAAYVATKLTQPLRIGATVVLTPIVARALAVLKRRRAKVTGDLSESTKG
jgi:hypothetical protein